MCFFLTKVVCFGVFFFFSTENQEKEDKVKEQTPEEPAAEKPAPKAKRGSSKESAPAFMASFFVVLEVYKTKTLVRKSSTHILLLKWQT